MSIFEAYLSLGFGHITDLEAYDHMLFIVALCALYQLKDWKKVLILVTAFTVGHSVTLALVSLELLSVSQYWVEVLIPVTIALTCVFNIFANFERKSSQVQKYLLALFFGLIHGMGFSNFFKATAKNTSDFVLKLFSFNIGVELGQLLIVLCVLALGFVSMNVLKVKQKYWNWGVSILVFLVSIRLLLNVI